MSTKLLIAPMKDNTIKVWDLESGIEVRRLIEHAKASDDALITQEENIAISKSFNGTIKVWDLYSGKAIHILQVNTSISSPLEITPDGKLIIFGTSDGRLGLWDLIEGREICSILAHEGASVFCVTISQDGSTAVTNSDDGSLKVWDLRNYKIKHVFNNSGGELGVVRLTQDGRRAISISGYNDPTIKIWDTEDGNLISTFQGESSIQDFDMTSDGRTIVVGEGSGRVHFLRLGGVA